MGQIPQKTKEYFSVLSEANPGLSEYFKTHFKSRSNALRECTKSDAKDDRFLLPSVTQLQSFVETFRSVSDMELEFQLLFRHMHGLTPIESIPRNDWLRLQKCIQESANQHPWNTKRGQEWEDDWEEEWELEEECRHQSKLAATRAKPTKKASSKRRLEAKAGTSRSDNRPAASGWTKPVSQMAPGVLQTRWNLRTDFFYPQSRRFSVEPYRQRKYLVEKRTIRKLGFLFHPTYQIDVNEALCGQSYEQPTRFVNEQALAMTCLQCTLKSEKVLPTPQTEADMLALGPLRSVRWIQRKTYRFGNWFYVSFSAVASGATPSHVLQPPMKWKYEMEIEVIRPERAVMPYDVWNRGDGEMAAQMIQNVLAFPLLLLDNTTRRIQNLLRKLTLIPVRFQT